MSEERIMVSICCLAYNHEKYIRQCLDGFLMQKTTFKYEVLIHDDASTDSTADIIREYEAKYPDIIKPIYQTENQFSKGVKISWKYQFPRAKGKYIALCEGDDYWIDENKLQKQFNAMETRNSSTVFCTHIVIEEINNSLGRIPKPKIEEQINDGIIDSKMWIKWCLVDYPFHTSSYFFRTSTIKDALTDPPSFVMVSDVGDIPLMLFLATKGSGCFLSEEMSFHRVNSLHSWSSRMHDVDYSIEHYSNVLQMLKSFNVFSELIYSEFVDTAITKREFGLILLSNDYKTALKKKYRPFFVKSPIRLKLKIVIFSIFPMLKNLWLNRGNKNNEQ